MLPPPDMPAEEEVVVEAVVTFRSRREEGAVVVCDEGAEEEADSGREGAEEEDVGGSVLRLLSYLLCVETMSMMLLLPSWTGWSGRRSACEVASGFFVSAVTAVTSAVEYMRASRSFVRFPPLLPLLFTCATT